MRRRYRRNQTQQALQIGHWQERPSGETPTAPKLQSIRGLSVLGIVINPRLNEPVLVTTDGENVAIRSLKEATLLQRHGSGYYDTSGYGKSKEIETATGLPRSHTPSGVTPEGRGYGTALYTALCLGAYLVDEGHADIKMDTKGWGISSESEGRSAKADKWWDAAYDRGLTERETDEQETEQEGVDLGLDASDIADCVSLDDNQELSYVNTVNVDITTTEELNVDKYIYYEARHPTEGAYGHDLIAVEIFQGDFEEDTVPDDIAPGSEIHWLVEQVMEDEDFIGDAVTDALLALDVRGLAVEAMNLLSLAYMKADLGDAEVDALWYRWEHSLDPGSKSPQLRLFSPNGRAGKLAEVHDARQIVGWNRLRDLP